MSPRPARPAQGLRAWGLALGLLGCSPAPKAAALPCAGGPCLARAQGRLDALRERWSPGGPRSFRLAVSFEGGPRGGFSARGACAIRPPDALRMQLVGPAGALALDLWARGGQARLAVPAIERVERDPEALGPGRPTAFLRWWLLAPLGGELLGADEGQGGVERFLLRAPGGDEILATSQGEALTLERRSPGDTERISARGPGCGEVSYRSEAAGLRVEVRCEGEAPPPSPRAFEDPDAPVAR